MHEVKGKIQDFLAICHKEFPPTTWTTTAFPRLGWLKLAAAASVVHHVMWWNDEGSSFICHA